MCGAGTTSAPELFMKAFVTGATGFVGSHVARVLAEQGADLRLLVRKTSRLENIASIPGERVTGRITAIVGFRA